MAGQTKTIARVARQKVEEKMTDELKDPRGPEYDEHRVAESAASLAEKVIQDAITFSAPPPSLLTITEVAAILQLKDRTVYNLANEGGENPETGLPFFFKVGGSWRARRKDLDAWLDQQAGK